MELTGVAAYFYLNEVLIAAHTTNVPAIPSYPNFYIDTEAGGAAGIPGAPRGLCLTRPRQLGRGAPVVVGGRPDDEGAGHLAARDPGRQRGQVGLPDPAVAGPLRPAVLHPRVVGHAGVRPRGVRAARHDPVGVRPGWLRPLRVAGE